MEWMKKVSTRGTFLLSWGKKRVNDGVIFAQKSNNTRYNLENLPDAQQ